MVLSLSEVVIDPKVREMCRLPYPDHPQGCPNFGRKRGCPPNRPLFALRPPYFAIINEFDLASHLERLRAQHPQWTEPQFECRLRWIAGRELAAELSQFRLSYPLLSTDTCPEASGVDVTGTLRRAGVVLEWPPAKVVRQVAIAGAVNREESLPSSARPSLAISQISDLAGNSSSAVPERLP